MTDLVRQGSYGFTPEQVTTIKSLINAKISDSELMVFLHICERTKLDPFSKQIYGIPRGGKLTIQTSIDGFRLIADRTGCYAPGRPTAFAFDDKGNLVSATAYVKKKAGGEWHEVAETAYMCEFQGNTPFWKKLPTVMLAKTAEARALRRAFPADLSGLYTSDEMDQADVVVDADPVVSTDTFEAIDRFIGDREELRQKLCRLCRVSSLRQIKQSQLEAVRSYAKKYIEKPEEEETTEGESNEAED